MEESCKGRVESCDSAGQEEDQERCEAKRKGMIVLITVGIELKNCRINKVGTDLKNGNVHHELVLFCVDVRCLHVRRYT